AAILEPLNAQRYGDAAAKAKTLISKHVDFDLPYKWLAAAHLQMGDIASARDVLLRGIDRSKRKCLLLTDLGEVEAAAGERRTLSIGGHRLSIVTRRRGRRSS